MPGITHQSGNYLGVPLAVHSHNLANWMQWIGKLGGSVDERAATESRSADFVPDRLNEPTQCGLSIGSGLNGLLDVVTRRVMAIRDVRNDQVVFCAIVLVERCLCYRRLGDETVDADRADACFIEESVGAVEDAHLRGGAVRGGEFLNDHHGGTPQTDAAGTEGQRTT